MTNGYASFDALDATVTDQTQGDIVRLVPTTKNITDGGVLLILCTDGSFASLVGKAQLFSADQNQATITATSNVLGDINPIAGGWGCSSPRSVAQYGGLVFWADWKNKDVVQYGANGATPVSQFKCSRLFRQLFSRITDPSLITGGVNPYCGEYLISFPAPNPSTKPVFPTTNIQDPFDCYYNDHRTYIYNWNLNKWVGSWESDAELINVGDDVYSWRGGFWKEFTTTPGSYYGQTKSAMIAVPFNESYPAVKSVLNLRGVMTAAPVAWVSADSMIQGVGVAATETWQLREGDYMAVILRDRLSNNASNTTEYNKAGINGNRLKGKTIKAVLVWTNGFTCSSLGLNWQPSSGH